MMKTLLRFLLPFAVAACASVPAPPATAPGPDFLARNAAAKNVVTTPSGLQYFVIRSGSPKGLRPTAADTVTFDYEGKLLTGETFDSSFERGTPLTGPIDGFVPGFTEALKLMRPGDEWVVWIPPALGYGDRASGPIPANSVLRFRLALRSVTTVAVARRLPDPPQVKSSIPHSAREVQAPGPLAPLAGTLIEAKRGAPVILIIPRTGPTDRDGNSPLGVKASSYRLLAEALAAKGVSSVRIDKRGMFGSKAAVVNPNAVTIADYAKDVRAWVHAARRATGVKCVWLLGHGEGGLVALSAAQQPAGVCGLVLAASPGRALGDTIRTLLLANRGNASILPQAFKALDKLEKGERVDVKAFHPVLQKLFAPAAQGYMIELLAQRPAALAANVRLPMLIVRGETDLQVPVTEARALSVAQPKARLLLVPGMNHVLKAAPAGRAANLATYADPSLPVEPAFVDEVAAFVKVKR
jgi:alpha-beta hydrolase superfamily lysophospholipase